MPFTISRDTGAPVYTCLPGRCLVSNGSKPSCTPTARLRTARLCRQLWHHPLLGRHSDHRNRHCEQRFSRAAVGAFVRPLSIQLGATESSRVRVIPHCRANWRRVGGG
jgi:hypothetical protein